MTKARGATRHVGQRLAKVFLVTPAADLIIASVLISRYQP
jgi:hypothetical protein